MTGVAHDEVTNFGWFSASVRYIYFDGGAPSAPPGQQDFWVVEQEGSGAQTLEWDIQDGNWTAVVMNGDATAPVSATVSLGARFGILLPIGIGLTVVGIVLLAVGIVLIVLGARRPRLAGQTQQPTAQGRHTWPRAATRHPRATAHRAGAATRHPWATAHRGPQGLDIRPKHSEGNPT